MTPAELNAVNHDMSNCLVCLCLTVFLTLDGFLAMEPNPTLTSALESSLWELYSHRQHYHASVSTLAKIFEEAFTRPSYAMEDFLDHTYGTVCLVLFPLLAILTDLLFAPLPELTNMIFTSYLKRK